MNNGNYMPRAGGSIRILEMLRWGVGKKRLGATALGLWPSALPLAPVPAQPCLTPWRSVSLCTEPWVLLSAPLFSFLCQPSSLCQIISSPSWALLLLYSPSGALRSHESTLNVPVGRSCLPQPSSSRGLSARTKPWCSAPYSLKVKPRVPPSILPGDFSATSLCLPSAWSRVP